MVFPVKEMAGIAGDGYAIDLSVPGLTGVAPGLAPLTLSKLGAEGPTLLDLLQRTWLVARAKADIAAEKGARTYAELIAERKAEWNRG